MSPLSASSEASAFLLCFLESLQFLPRMLKKQERVFRVFTAEEVDRVGDGSRDRTMFNADDIHGGLFKHIPDNCECH
jgi:hypothetical protein